ncbi:MAG: replicative DNA helicase [Ignavibacteria bacterium]|nr:replicative DNA helicase [Ignavibacteria bacterium]
MSTPFSSDSPAAYGRPGTEQQNAGKLPPQAVEVEKAVLGAMLLQSDTAVSVALSLVTREAFYTEAHRTIFDAITALYHKNQPVDIITVADELRRGERLDSAGSMYYLSQLTSEVVSPAHIEYHCRIVLEKALKRQLIEVNSQIITDCYAETSDAFEVIDKAETMLFDLSEQHVKKSYVDLNSVVMPLLDRIRKITTEHTGVTGVPSGYELLDYKTGGWQNTDLIILAARPSMGKTALALSMARNAAIDHDMPVGIFSLEMSTEQLALRLLCAEARVSMQLVRTGRIKEADYGKLATYVGKLQRAKIYIDDTPGISILELRAKSRRMVQEHGVRMLIVDYLQLMTAPNIRESREREIATISRSLKGLAKDLKIPIIAISQLNRSVESRAGGKPMLADLRESGSIEQDADVVLFVHRNKDGDAVPPEELNKAFVIIGKQRNGETGEVPIAWVPEYARFENLATNFPNVHYLPEPDESPF